MATQNKELFILAIVALVAMVAITALVLQGGTQDKRMPTLVLNEENNTMGYPVIFFDSQNGGPGGVNVERSSSNEEEE